MLRSPDPETHPQFYDGVALKRLLAWVVDVTLIALVCVVLLPFTAFTGVFFFPAMMMLVGYVYRLVTLANGSATWGMRLMAIEFRDAGDAPFDFVSAFLHTSGYALSVAMTPLQLISMVMMATTPRAQGLTDMILGTVAINRRAQR